MRRTAPSSFDRSWPASILPVLVATTVPCSSTNSVLGKRHHAHVGDEVGRRVVQEVVGDAGPGGQLRRLGPVVTGVEPDELDLVAHLLVHLLEVGHLLQARHAPGGPHVHDQGPAAVGGEVGGAAGEELVAGGRQRRPGLGATDRDRAALLDRAGIAEAGVDVVVPAAAGDQGRGHDHREEESPGRAHVRAGYRRPFAGIRSPGSGRRDQVAGIRSPGSGRRGRRQVAGCQSGRAPAWRPTGGSPAATPERCGTGGPQPGPERDAVEPHPHAIRAAIDGGRGTSSTTGSGRGCLGGRPRRRLLATIRPSTKS